MNKDLTYYQHLLNRYFTGEAGKQQMEELHAWIKADPENKKLFHEYAKTWQKVNEHTIYDEVDLKQALEKNRLLRLQSENIPGKTISIFKNAAFRVAASLILLAGLFFVLRFIITGDKMQEVTAASGVIEVALPDGSKVSLAEGASLKYPDDFGPDERKVYLWGKAYFTVQKDTGSAFMVSCNDAMIKVLGTSFLAAYSEDAGKLEVVLDEGKLAVFFEEKPENQMIMEPAERIEASLKTLQIVKKQNTDPNYLSWKTHNFSFENSPLPEVFQVLSDAYNINITMDADLSECTLTAEFEEQSLNSVLKVIQSVFDLQYKKTEKFIRVSGKPCKQTL